MELFKEIDSTKKDSTLESYKRTQRPKIVYEKFNVERTNEQELSLLAQYFLALFVLVDSNGILDIPDTDDFTHKKIIEEIAPHFNETVKVTSESKTTVRLKSAKESSKNHFLNLMDLHQLNLVVNDLYAKSKERAWEGNFTSKEYKVNLLAVEEKNDAEISLLWDFLNRSFVCSNGYVVLLPNGWGFNESFKDRIAVQAFSSVCNSMTVIVNCNSHLITSIMMD